MTNSTSYRIYYTDVPGAKYTPDLKHTLIPFARPSKLEAFKTACEIEKQTDAFVWEIEGPDNFHMDREEWRQQFFRMQ